LVETTPHRTLRILPRHVPRLHPGEMMPLKHVRAGHHARLIAVRLAPADRNHLYQQGFVEGRKVLVLHNDHRGRVMLKLHGEIFLLGRRETSRIEVREFIER